jgi:hypothetical protein
MEESTPVIKIAPSLKIKILSFMIPIVIVAGILKAVMDHFDPTNTQEQNLQATGALLVAYCFFSFRGLNRYRVFMELGPDKLTWRQGFKLFGKNLSLNYSQIESVTITSLTSTLIIALKPEKGFPKILRLPHSFQSDTPAISNISALKSEIEKRKRFAQIAT